MAVNTCVAFAMKYHLTQHQSVKCNEEHQLSRIFQGRPLVETEVGLDNGVLNDSSLPTNLESAQHLLSSTTGVPAASQSFLKILHLGLQRIENLDHFCYFKKI